MDEIGGLWKYIHKLENLLVKSIKQNNKFKKNVKNKLNSLCLLIVDKGIKPDDIVKIINSSGANQQVFDNSDNSDYEIGKKEINLSDKNKDLIKTENPSNSDSDSEMELIAQQIDEEKNSNEDALDNLKKMRKFIEKNHQILNKEFSTEMDNESRLILNGDSKINSNKNDKYKINSNSNRDKEFLNKKRKTENLQNE